MLLCTVCCLECGGMFLNMIHLPLVQLLTLSGLSIFGNNIAFFCVCFFFHCYIPGTPGVGRRGDGVRERNEETPSLGQNCGAAGTAPASVLYVAGVIDCKEDISRFASQIKSIKGEKHK
ncbi:hypothetical protein FKM82_000253 [Ascaphus truei]